MIYAVASGISQCIESELHRLLTKHLVDFKLDSLSAVDPGFLSSCEFYPGGVDPEDALARFSTTTQVELEGRGVTILLLSTPLTGGRRFHIDSENKLAVASIYSLEGDVSEAKNCAALIFAILIRIKFETEEEHVSRRCGLSPNIYGPFVPTEICSQCRESLPHSGASIVRAFHSLMASAEKNGQFVLVQHGIQTYAGWAEPVAQCLEEYGFVTKVYRYGFFPIYRLLMNRYFGISVKDKFYKKYESAKKANPNAEISVIAHSYGTMLVAQVLNERPDVVLDKLILVNGIVPRDYDWDRHIRAGRVRGVLNECGDKDIAPVVAEKVIPGAGASGVLFFEDSDSIIINTRYKNCGHSKLLSTEHCKTVWKEFLSDDHWQPESARNPDVKWFPTFVDRWGLFVIVPVMLMGALLLWLLGDWVLPSTGSALIDLCRWVGNKFCA